MADGYPITCSECGRKDEVPFKPDLSKPVKCRECFNKGRAAPEHREVAAAGKGLEKSLNGSRDSIMARMSAFRGLSEICGSQEGNPCSRVIWVLRNTNDVTEYLLTGSNKLLDSVMETLKDLEKQGVKA